MEKSLMKNVLTAAALALLAASGVAVAQAADDGPGRTETVTRAQAQARASAMFDRLDLNHDGKLDQADRDLRIQQEFDRIDTNHDGQISRAEFAAAQSRGRGGPGHQAKAGQAGPAPGGARGWNHRGMGGGMGGGPMMWMADANHDGVITKDEFVNAALKRFDMADTNHDGKLTPQERKAARQAMREKWRQAHPEGPGGDPSTAPGNNPSAPAG
jgi:hypothetical protein